MFTNLRLWLIRKLQPYDWEDNMVPSMQGAVGVLPLTESNAILERAMKASAKHLISHMQTLGYNISTMNFELEVPNQQVHDYFELSIRRTTRSGPGMPTYYKHDMSTRT